MSEDKRVIAIGSGGAGFKSRLTDKALPRLSDDNCQPSVNDFDEIEDWKGPGKRKMPRIK